MNQGGGKFFIVLMIIGVSVLLFFMSRNQEGAESQNGKTEQEHVKGSFRDLQVDFLDRLYEADGVDQENRRNPQEEKPFASSSESEEGSVSGSDEDPEKEDSTLLNQKARTQKLLKEFDENLFWMNLKDENGVVTLYLRGTFAYSESGEREGELLQKLTEILITQEDQELVVYRNGRLESFGAAQGQPSGEIISGQSSA